MSTVYTGPRGGRYTIDKMGRKKYLPKARIIPRTTVRRRRITGRGIGDVYTRVKTFFTGRSAGPPAVRDLISKQGIQRIAAITVCRIPVQSYIQSLLKIVSFGRSEDIKAKLAYDNLYHLYMNITLENGVSFSLEKNQVVTVGKARDRAGSKCVSVPDVGAVTLKEFIDRGEKALGRHFYHYDFERYNCQNFVSTLLRSSGMLTSGLDKFINQDIVTVAKSLPSAFKSFANFVTDVAGRLDILQHGAGISQTSLKYYPSYR